MSDLKLTGEIYKIFDKQTFNSGYEKIQFVVKTEGEYPQLVKMQVSQKNIRLIEGAEVGDSFTFFFNLRGREWVKDENETHYFVDIDVWRTTENSKTDEEPAEKAIKDAEIPF